MGNGLRAMRNDAGSSREAGPTTTCAVTAANPWSSPSQKLGTATAIAADMRNPADALRAVDEAERRLIVLTLEHTRDNTTRAAEILGISLKTLHNKLNRLGLRKGVGG